MPTPTIFLLSPARCSSERASMLVDPRARFPLARRLHAGDATIGEVFSFLSALYFRGKLTYARAFAQTPKDLPGVYVIVPGAGLRQPEEPIDAARFRSFGEVPIDVDDPRWIEPLRRDVAIAARLFDGARVVLLGSVATEKYVGPLVEAFGERLLFPPDFVGRGDMSRGGLLLRAARAGVELPYAPVATTKRTGARAPGASRTMAARRK